MKICILSGIFPPQIGGPAIYVKRLAEELSSKGIGVKVITYGGKVASDHHNFKVVRVSKKYPKGIRHLIFLIKTFMHCRGSNVIYAQNLFSTGIPGLIASKLLRKKFIVKIVGDYAWEQSLARGWFRGGIDDFQKAKSLRINFIKRIQKTLASAVDVLITPSNYLKGIISGWGVQESKIKVIYNAVEDLPSLDLSKEGAQKKIGIKGDILLSIGRLAPWKGFSCLIGVMKDLVERNPNFKLLIIGEGPEKANLELKIKDLGLEENVKLMGKVAHQDLSSYFKAADIFVLNTGYEGFPHVILEAMQGELPIITTRKGGNVELIDDGVSGLLVEYDNLDELSGAILKLWQDKDLRDKFILNSREKLKEFSWEKLFNETLEVL